VAIKEILLSNFPKGSDLGEIMVSFGVLESDWGELIGIAV
jgi:hypothetical protein